MEGRSQGKSEKRGLSPIYARFLSSEDGRAPDANTLISAGIGFCFMTQFGRFVSMLKLDLPDYRIVQDTHFSLGGASGGTGHAGEADPIESHVYLETGEMTRLLGRCSISANRPVSCTPSAAPT